MTKTTPTDAWIKFLTACNNASMHWYSIPNIPTSEYTSLADLLSISQESLEEILVLSGFAQRGANGVFRFLQKKFFQALDASDGSLSSMNALNQRAIPSLKNKKCVFVRIGTKAPDNSGSTTTSGGRDPFFRGTPPRIPSFRSISKEFLDVFRSILDADNNQPNYSMSNHTGSDQHQGDDGVVLEQEEGRLTIHRRNPQPPPGDGTASTDEEEDIQQEPLNDETDNTPQVIMYLSSLLPEICCVSPSSPSIVSIREDVEPAAVEAAILNMAAAILEKKDRDLSAILKTESYDISPRTKGDTSKFVHLRRRGIPIEDKRSQMALLKDIHTLQRTKEKGKHLTYDNGRANGTSFVHIPASSSYAILKRYANEQKWVHQLLSLLAGGSDNTDDISESLVHLLTYFAKHPSYREEFNLVAGSSCHFLTQPRIDGPSTRAVQQMCNLSMWQMRQLRDCLAHHIGCPVFQSEYKIKKLVDVESMEILSGMHKEGSERIPWVFRRTTDVLRRWLQSLCDEHQEEQGHRRTEKTVMHDEEEVDGKKNGHHSCSSSSDSHFEMTTGHDEEEVDGKKKKKGHHSCSSSVSCFVKSVHVVDCVINLDHGGGYSRVSAHFIARRKHEVEGKNDDGHDYNQDDDNQEHAVIWEDISYSTCLGNARCKKDSLEVIQSTFGKHIDDDLALLARMGSAFRLVNGKLVLGGGTGREEETIRIEVFLASDILLHTLILGKVGSSGYWCTYCDLGKPSYQTAGHERGNSWTIEGLLAHFASLQNLFSERLSKWKDKNKNKRKRGGLNKDPTWTDLLTVEERKGVSGKPIFQSIPIDRMVVPRLHVKIGKGNDILKHLLNVVQCYAEEYSEAYLKAEQSLAVVALELDAKRMELQDFHRFYSNYMENIGVSLDHDNTLTEVEQDAAERELEDLQANEKELFQDIRMLRERVKTAKAAFEVEKSAPENSKVNGQPVLAAIEEILGKHGIDRSNLFGGAINGNACSRFMERSEDILGDITEFCKNRLSRLPGRLDNFLQAMRGIRVYLGALDGLLGALASCKRFRGNDIAYENCRKFRDKFLEIERYLGMPITPKSHMLEDHVLDQLIRFKGIGDLDEEFGERMHKDQTKVARQFGVLRNFLVQHKSMYYYFDCRHHPLVRNSLVEMEKPKENPRKRKQKQVEMDADQRRQKRIRLRHDALNFQLSATDPPLESMKSVRQKAMATGSFRLANSSAPNAEEVGGD